MGGGGGGGGGSVVTVPNSYDNRSFLLEAFPDYNTIAGCLQTTESYQRRNLHYLNNQHNQQHINRKHSGNKTQIFTNATHTPKGEIKISNSNRSLASQQQQQQQQQNNNNGVINNNSVEKTTSTANGTTNDEIVLTLDIELPLVINNDLCGRNRHQESTLSSASLSSWKKITSVKQDKAVRSSAIKVPLNSQTSSSLLSRESKYNNELFCTCAEEHAASLIETVVDENSSCCENYLSRFLVDGQTRISTGSWCMTPDVSTLTMSFGGKEIEEEEGSQVNCHEKDTINKRRTMEIGSVCEEAEFEEEDESSKDELDEHHRCDTVDFLTQTSRRQCYGERLQRSMTMNDSEARKLSRDESVTSPRSTLLRCNSIDSTQSMRGSIDEHTLFLEKPSHKQHKTRKISTGSKQRNSKKKILQRSMSLGFSKFKSLSLFKGHNRFNDEDFQLDFNSADHQTSRRKNTTGSSCGSPTASVSEADSPTIAGIAAILDTTCIIVDEGYEKFDKLTGNQLNNYPPLMRSLSAPDPIDKLEGSDEYDEDLSDLYLPRRRAICPNLPVPAMKQLKTYLILTRLKQYCFV